MIFGIILIAVVLAGFCYLGNKAHPVTDQFTEGKHWWDREAKYLGPSGPIPTKENCKHCNSH